MKEFAAEVVRFLIGSIPALLMVIGAALVGIGILGAVKDWFGPLESFWRLISIALGIVGIGGGVLLSRRVGELVAPDIKRIGVRIITPQKGDPVDQIDVRGDVKEELPAGFTLRVMRVYRDGRIAPTGPRTVHIKDKEWTAHGCSIGGPSGDETRAFGAFIVGKSGEVLISYFEEASRVHADQLRAIAKSDAAPGVHLPALNNWEQSAIYLCDKVMVKRR